METSDQGVEKSAFRELASEVRNASTSEQYTSLLATELRTSIGTVVSYLDLLDKDGLLNDPEALRRYLALVQGRAADVARLVSELVVVTNVSSWHPPTYSPGEVPTLASILRVAAGDRPLELEIEGGADCPVAHPDRLRLILRHIFDAASASTRIGRSIHARAYLELDGGRLVLEVSDPEGVWSEFGSAPRLSAAEGSGGLEALLARQSAEALGGRLVVEQRPHPVYHLEVPLEDHAAAREADYLHRHAVLKDAQAIRAIEDLRVLRSLTEQERKARELAEAQQLRAIEDFRSAHDRAVALAHRLDDAYLETITALAKAVEARDAYTGGHVERVRGHSLKIARLLGFRGDDIRQLEFGAVLHDVGKIGVPDAMLAKPGPLTPEEWEIMKQHPEIGRRVLEGTAFLTSAIDAVAFHHERWDGKGYPYQRSEVAIPLVARVVAVADAYDAMVTDRPYRKGLPLDVARQEIEKCRGTQFDPDIAATFLTTLDEG